MLGKLAIFALLVLIHQSESKLPSYLKPCARTDPNFNDCAKKNALIAVPSLLKGDKKFKIPALSPLEVPQLKIQQGPNLKIILDKLKLSGLENGQIKDLNFNFKDKKFQTTIYSPKLRLVSDYDISGKILVLPINGKGPCTMEWDDVTFTYTLEYELYKKNGVDYIKPKKANIVYELKNLHVQFDNLFNGDKVLGATTNTFLNENWREVNKELGPAVSEALSQCITLILKTLLDVTPYDEIFPEKV